MKQYRILLIGLILPGLAWAPCCRAAQQVLFDFARNPDLTKVITRDAIVVADTGTPLKVATGHQEPWPGITLTAPNAQWDLSKYEAVAVAVKNPDPNPLSIFCRVDNPGADGEINCVTGSLSLKPNESGTLRVELKRHGPNTRGGKLFGMRGYPEAPGGKGTINPAKVNQLLIFLTKPKTNHTFEIAQIRAEGADTQPVALTADPEPYFPCIDIFGQYRHRDWPGKTHSLAELAQQRQEEAAELASKPGPNDWNQYGGWKAGPQLEATGFFRVQKYEGKWWLVDPEGRLFFSQGIDCVRMIDVTAIEERTEWFEDFPGEKAEFKEFLGAHRSEEHTSELQSQFVT
jgi:hypothetical protein